MSYQQRRRSDEDEDEQEIQEDRPQMRSMAIMPSAAAAPSLGFAGVSSSFPPPLAKPSPFGLRRAVEPELKQQPSAQKATTTSNNNSKPTWSVRSVPSVPEFYFLEKTHVYVNGSSPSVISQRIADCLQRKSIVIAIDGDSSDASDTNEASCEAETCDGVRFHIKLWAGDGGNGGGEEVIVETQRLSGCCYQYCQAARSVLHSAKGIEKDEDDENIRRLPCANKRKLPPAVPAVPQCVLSCGAAQTQQEREGCVDEALSIARKLLLDHRDRHDCQHMALESYVQLTATAQTSSSISCSSYAAKSILSTSDVRDALISYVQQKPTATASQRHHHHDEREEERCTAMRRNALTVLANCFVALEETAELSQVLATSCRNLDTDSLLRVLASDVEQCHARPHHACQAVRILSCLMKTSSSAATPAIAQQQVRELLGGSPLLTTTASNEGLCRHAQLYEETQKLQLRL